MYGYNNHRVALQDLIAFAWSAPMRELAAKTGMSDVGLKKLLKSYGVSGPPQGHWNRVHAGRQVEGPPKPPERGPGERPYIHVDGRLAHLPEAPVPSSAGPFASAKVPENLEEMRTRELNSIGRAASAAKLATAHPAISSLLAGDEKERAKAAANRWHTPVILYESPFEKRRLRILNAIFLTLERKGHGGRSDRHDHHTTFSAHVGHTGVQLILDDAKHKAIGHNPYNAPRPDPKRAASTKLKLSAGESTWQDDDSGLLESRIAEICAGIIVEGERALRDHLRVLEEEAERARIEAERLRRERLRKANADRVAALMESGRLLAEAEHLRSLIAKVATAVEAGTLEATSEELARWRQWAEQEADKLDPVISGQVRAHLLPPNID